MSVDRTAEPLRVFVSTDFKGHWPVGVAAVMLARNAEEARDFLRVALAYAGLGEQSDFKVNELDAQGAYILANGDY